MSFGIFIDRRLPAIRLSAQVVEDSAGAAFDAIGPNLICNMTKRRDEFHE